MQNKVKMFVWRVAHNSLQVKLNIARRGVDLDTRCPMCWRLDEDGGPLLSKMQVGEKAVEAHEFGEYPYATTSPG